MTACDDTRLLLGSYALGGLDDGETVQVERHLGTCEACRREHAELVRLPALLDLVEPDSSVLPQPSSRLEDAVVAGFAAQRSGATSRGDGSRTRRTRRPPRWRVALPSALAGAAAAVGALGIAGVLSSSADDGRPVTLTSPSGVGGARAQARLTDTSAGTAVELEAELPPLRRGEVYELWFVRAGGRVSAGTFTVGPDGRADLRLITAARGPGYGRVGITREPDALDPGRNGPSVVVGTLGS
jgi:anti-sigma factor RsiW